MNVSVVLPALSRPITRTVNCPTSGAVATRERRDGKQQRNIGPGAALVRGGRAARRLLRDDMEALMSSFAAALEKVVEQLNAMEVVQRSQAAKLDSLQRQVTQLRAVVHAPRSNLRVRFADDDRGPVRSRSLDRPRSAVAPSSPLVSRSASGGSGADGGDSFTTPPSARGSAARADAEVSSVGSNGSGGGVVVAMRRTLLTGTVVNGLPLALRGGDGGGSVRGGGGAGAGGAPPKKREEFVLGYLADRKGVPSATDASDELRARSKELAKRTQQEVLKKQHSGSIDALVRKHSLSYARVTTLQDALEDIRAEEDGVLRMIQDKKKDAKAKVELFDGLAAADVAGAVSRARDILTLRPKWKNEAFFHRAVDDGSGAVSLTVPRAGDKATPHRQPPVEGVSPGRNVQPWSCTFLQAAVHVRSVPVTAWLLRFGACGRARECAVFTGRSPGVLCCTTCGRGHRAFAVLCALCCVDCVVRCQPCRGRRHGIRIFQVVLAVGGTGAARHRVSSR